MDGLDVGRWLDGWMDWIGYLEGELLANGKGDGVVTRLLQALSDTDVVTGVTDDGHPGVVLGGGPEQRDPTNINLLNSLLNGHIGLSHLLLERIQIADNHVNVVVTPGSHVCVVALNVPGENPCNTKAIILLRGDPANPKKKKGAKPP